MLQMNEGREIWRVNSFTKRPFTGNPAGVVPEARACRMHRCSRLPRN